MRNSATAAIALTTLLFAGLYGGSVYSYPGEPLCSDGYRADSYGRGIEAGFKGIDNLRPRHSREANEDCYQRGVRKGVSLHYETQIFDCEGDFEDGYEEGFKASPLSAGTACYSGGYSAGKAALRVGAREGARELVGDECVDAFQKGYEDSMTGQVATIPLTNPEATCYRAGYYDARR